MKNRVFRQFNFYCKAYLRIEKRFSERCRGPFWIRSSYMNVTPAHVCCGRIHKAKISKSKKKRGKDEEVATPQEKIFEANKEMEEVEKAKATDERENNAATENYLVS